MQSLETSFVLMAAQRYVHAFVICTSAIDGALRAARIGSKDRDDFQTLIRKARNASGASTRLMEIPQTEIDGLRENRNRIVHRGFSPKDNSVCVHLFISVALPLLDVCYEDYHAISLHRDLGQDQAFARHLSIAAQVCTRALPLGVDMTYCIGSFAHLVRWFLKPNFTGDWEDESLIHGEEIGLNWKLKDREKSKIERLFSMPWTFNCPVCEEFESVVCDLKAENQQLIPTRMACTNCSYVVRDSQPFISDILLREQLTEELQHRILKEYGLDVNLNRALPKGNLVLRFIRLIHRDAPVLVFPAKAVTHVWHGHRPSPVWQKL
jgi:hypothetical protein